MPRGSTPRLRQHRARLVVALIGATIALAMACAPAVDTAIVAEPGQSFSLPQGKTATLNGTAVKITFTTVKEDSRCAIDVQCVWAGDAKVELRVDREGATETTILSLTAPNNETTLGDLRIRFVGLAPAPRQADRDRPREYVAQLVISRG